MKCSICDKRAFWWLDLHTRACDVGMLISLETSGSYLSEAVMWGLSVES